MGDMTVLYALIGALTGIIIGHVLSYAAMNAYDSYSIKKRRKEYVKKIACSNMNDGSFSYPALHVFSELGKKERVKNNDKTS